MANIIVGVTNSLPGDPAPTASNMEICGRGKADPQPSEKVTVTCPVAMTPGRYVGIVREVTECLTLCEVEVFGSLFTHVRMSQLWVFVAMVDIDTTSELGLERLSPLPRGTPK